jgi:hypothetical protein
VDTRAAQPRLTPSLSLSPLLDHVNGDAIVADNLPFDDAMETLLPEYLHVRETIQSKESETDEHVSIATPFGMTLHDIAGRAKLSDL